MDFGTTNCFHEIYFFTRIEVLRETGKVVDKRTQIILDLSAYFTEDILHYGKPKTIQLVRVSMGHLYKKLDRFFTTIAFLLVLMLMRKFCQPQ